MDVVIEASREENVFGPATQKGDEVFFDAGNGNTVLTWEDWVLLGRPDKIKVTISRA